MRKSTIPTNSTILKIILTDEIRHVLPLLFLFLLTNPIHGQFESIFGNENTEWNYLVLYCDATMTETFIQEDEVVVNNVTYTQVSGIGLLRESESHDKLWYLDPETEEEILLMDMDLATGDFFEINGTEYQVESTIDLNGKKVLQFLITTNTCGNFEMFQFIEGLGPNVGFRFMFTHDELDLRLIKCQTKNMETISFYDEEYGENCIVDFVSTKDLSESETEIYPVPFENELMIEFEEAGNKTIALYDLLGTKLLEIRTLNNKVQLQTDHLIKGNYLLRIQEGDQILSKIITKSQS